MKNKYKTNYSQDRSVENVQEVTITSEGRGYPNIEDVTEVEVNDLNEWSLISEEQHTGKTYLVTSDVTFEGVRAFWRKTRALSHNKWVLHGKWTEPLTNAEVLPQPLFYKDV